MLGDGVLHASVDWKEGLFGTPVELLNVMTAKGIDHSSYGGSRATTRVIEVEHSLNSTGLQTIDERAGVSIEWSV